MLRAHRDTTLRGSGEGGATRDRAGQRMFGTRENGPSERNHWACYFRQRDEAVLHKNN